LLGVFVGGVGGVRGVEVVFRGCLEGV
jgi:hypothetical protein